MAADRMAWDDFITWEYKASLPERRIFASVEKLNKGFLVFGGCQSTYWDVVHQ
jgi:hypothetical protein